MSIRAISVLSALAATIWLGYSPAAAQTNTRVIETVPTAGGLTQVANLNATFKTQQAETAPAAATTAKRVALVIGNSAYKAVTPLNNPVNDGKAISQFLTTAGFDVISAVDLTREQMEEVFTTFTSMISERGPNTIALVYYAGHGLQVDGENFLVPVDAKIEKEEDIAVQGVRLLDVMKTLELVPRAMSIVIMDACRNNPFSAIGDVAGKGLAIVDAPTGSIVAYSTAPGAEALDGVGRFSPYAAALMKASKQPGLSIELVFKRVRLLVNEATDGKQVPWESSSLTADFAFFSPNGTVGQIIQAAPAPKVSRVAEIATRPVQDAYSIAIEEDSAEYYEEFIRVYPTHPLCDRIRNLLSRRQQVVAWHQTVKRNTAADYAAFASKFVNSDFARHALRLQIKPRSQPLLPVVSKVNFPNGGIFNRNNQGNGGIFNRNNQGNGGFNNGNNGGGLSKVGIPGNLGGNSNGNNNGNNNGANNGGRPGLPAGGVATLPTNGNQANNGNPANNAGGSRFGTPGIIGKLPNVNGVNTANTGAAKVGGQVVTLPTNGGVSRVGNPGGQAVTLPQGAIKTAPVVTTRPGTPAGATLPSGSAINQRVINGGNTGINPRVLNGGNPAINTQINRVQVQRAPVISQAVQAQSEQRFQAAPIQRQQLQRNFSGGNLGGGNLLRRR